MDVQYYIEDTKKKIRSLLLSAPVGLTLKELVRDYKDFLGEPIPYSKCGYASLGEMLKEFTDVLRVDKSHGTTCLLAVADDNTKHIEKLVSKQKLTKPFKWQTIKCSRTTGRYSPRSKNEGSRKRKYWREKKPVSDVSFCTRRRSLPLSAKKQILLSRTPHRTTRLTIFSSTPRSTRLETASSTKGGVKSPRPSRKIVRTPDHYKPDIQSEKRTSPNSHVPSSLRKNIILLMKMYPSGIPLEDFEAAFHLRFKTRLNISCFRFRSITELLSNMQDVVKLRKQGREIYVLPVKDTPKKPSHTSRKTPKKHMDIFTEQRKSPRESALHTAKNKKSPKHRYKNDMVTLVLNESEAIISNKENKKNLDCQSVTNGHTNIANIDGFESYRMDEVTHQEDTDAEINMFYSNTNQKSGSINQGSHSTVNGPMGNENTITTNRIAGKEQNDQATIEGRDTNTGDGHQIKRKSSRGTFRHAVKSIGFPNNCPILPVSPQALSNKQASHTLHIQNLSRPFTVKELSDVLKRNGAIVEQYLWIDPFRTECFVTYKNLQDAITARNELHGARWPQCNKKKLKVEFYVPGDTSEESIVDSRYEPEFRKKRPKTSDKISVKKPRRQSLKSLKKTNHKCSTHTEPSPRNKQLSSRSRKPVSGNDSLSLTPRRWKRDKSRRLCSENAEQTEQKHTITRNGFLWISTDDDSDGDVSLKSVVGYCNIKIIGKRGLFTNASPRRTNRHINKNGQCNSRRYARYSSESENEWASNVSRKRGMEDQNSRSPLTKQYKREQGTSNKTIATKRPRSSRKIKTSPRQTYRSQNIHRVSKRQQLRRSIGETTPRRKRGIENRNSRSPLRKQNKKDQKSRNRTSRERARSLRKMNTVMTSPRQTYQSQNVHSVSKRQRLRSSLRRRSIGELTPRRKRRNPELGTSYTRTKYKRNDNNANVETTIHMTNGFDKRQTSVDRRYYIENERDSQLERNMARQKTQKEKYLQDQTNYYNINSNENFMCSGNSSGHMHGEPSHTDFSGRSNDYVRAVKTVKPVAQINPYLTNRLIVGNTKDVNILDLNVRGRIDNVNGIDRNERGRRDDVNELDRHVRGRTDDVNRMDRNVRGRRDDVNELDRNVRGRTDDVNGMDRQARVRIDGVNEPDSNLRGSMYDVNGPDHHMHGRIDDDNVLDHHMRDRMDNFNGSNRHICGRINDVNRQDRYMRCSTITINGPDRHMRGGFDDVDVSDHHMCGRMDDVNEPGSHVRGRIGDVNGPDSKMRDRMDDVNGPNRHMRGRIDYVSGPDRHMHGRIDDIYGHDRHMHGGMRGVNGPDRLMRGRIGDIYGPDHYKPQKMNNVNGPDRHSRSRMDDVSRPDRNMHGRVDNVNVPDPQMHGRIGGIKGPDRHMFGRMDDVNGPDDYMRGRMDDLNGPDDYMRGINRPERQIHGRIDDVNGTDRRMHGRMGGINGPDRHMSCRMDDVNGPDRNTHGIIEDVNVPNSHMRGRVDGVGSEQDMRDRMANVNDGGRTIKQEYPSQTDPGQGNVKVEPLAGQKFTQLRIPSISGMSSAPYEVTSSADYQDMKEGFEKFCTVCDVKITSVKEEFEHYRGSLHAYNYRLASLGGHLFRIA